MARIVLLGDSILDNARYVAPGKELTSHVRRMLTDDSSVVLEAVDGSVLADVPSQIRRVPDNATHLFFSCGGNDALGYLELLAQPVGTMAETLIKFNEVRKRFHAAYERVLRDLLGLEKRLTVFTIYHPVFDEPALQEAAEAALCIFNDGITRAAFARGIDVVDLRLLFDDPADMANPIEPSDQGGQKIAAVIKHLAESEITLSTKSTVYPRVP